MGYTMSKNVFVGSEEFTLNTQGDSAGWGEDQQDLIQALIDAVNSYFGPGDIFPTSVLINNNQTTMIPVPYLYFDPAIVRFAEINYTCIRVGTTTVYEVGKIFALNDPTVTSGNPWSLNIQNVGQNNAGITFDINSSGQVTYTTNDMTGYENSQSKMVFSARAIIK